MLSYAEVTDTQEQKPKKEYKFTEVSTGTKKDIRRFSQSKQFTGIQKIPTHGPLLKCQDISSYKPDTKKLDEILLRIKKNNERKVELINANQVNKIDREKHLQEVLDDQHAERRDYEEVGRAPAAEHF